VAGVSVTYPLGRSNEEAAAARAKLERQQSEERLKSAESRAIQQVRDAGWKIDMNAKRIATTRAARELADQRLDAERKRFDVGLSTSFFVIQAQRDLAQAKANELAAILAYDLALVDFEALQEAGPAGQPGASSAPAQPQTTTPTTTSAATPAAAAATAARPTTTSFLGF
jgi:outer membrane protein TolC